MRTHVGGNRDGADVTTFAPAEGIVARRWGFGAGGA